MLVTKELARHDMQDNTTNSKTGIQAISSICPLLTESTMDLTLKHYQIGDPGRGRLTLMIQQLFEAAYDADVKDYCEDLVGLESESDLIGVAGLRPADHAARLFSEQYLDIPTDKLISAHTGQDVERSRVIEIGNLAVNGTGQSRWLFAILTAFLHSAGYDWVICTAISPLISIFRRIGLEPVMLGDADPASLSGDASSWGRYYDLQPKVCFGSIAAGYQKMNAAITSRQPRLQRLWRQAHIAGKAYASRTSTDGCVYL